MASQEELFRKNFEKQSSPVSVSVSWDLTEDTEEMKIAWFEAFGKLPLSIRFGLCLEEIGKRIEKINQAFGFEKDLGRVGEVARLVREIFTRGLKEADLLLRIREKLGLSGEKRTLFYQEIKKTALLAQELGQKEFDLEFERQPVVKAFNLYPETRDQKMTDQPIYAEEEKTPHASSLENWLRDYLLQTGSKKHSAVDRSRYLFEAENPKKLNSTERENLAILLKSYDEGFPLIINKEEKKIELAESRKIDENWLASLAFFLGKAVENVKQKQEVVGVSRFSRPTQRFSQPVVGKKERKEPSFSATGMKNVLDLSDFN